MLLFWICYTNFHENLIDINLVYLLSANVQINTLIDLSFVCVLQINPIKLSSSNKKTVGGWKLNSDWALCMKLPKFWDKIYQFRYKIESTKKKKKINQIFYFVSKQAFFSSFCWISKLQHQNVNELKKNGTQLFHLWHLILPQRVAEKMVNVMKTNVKINEYQKPKPKIE